MAETTITSVRDGAYCELDHGRWAILFGTEVGSHFAALSDDDVRRTTMLDLTKDQRQLLSDKLPDAANVILGAVVLGPFLDQGGFSAVRVVGGLALWLAAFGLCFYIGRRK